MELNSDQIEKLKLIQDKIWARIEENKRVKTDSTYAGITIINEILNNNSNVDVCKTTRVFQNIDGLSISNREARPISLSYLNFFLRNLGISFIYEEDKNAIEYSIHVENLPILREKIGKFLDQNIKHK